MPADSRSLPQVISDGPLASTVTQLLAGHVDLLPWSAFEATERTSVAGIFTYGHPQLDGSLMDRVPGVKVISNCGVGVDHICVADAKQRGIPVGNTPGILDGATADMGFCLLMATVRRLAEGDRHARSAGFVSYDPGYMLGREVHGGTLGILGMGRIGGQIARRALAFDMEVLYHNRRRDQDAEARWQARYVPFDTLLRDSDFLMVCVPLNSETAGMIGVDELNRMRPTACLINIARGAIIDTDALTAALQSGQLYAAGLDVTDPEPLPRDHPLLELNNVIITPHLGSATVQTRQRMAELACANLLAGLRGEPLLHEV